MDFSGFSADSHQENNPEGIVRLWKILSKSFTAEYPVKADVATGEITVNPVSRLPANFVPAEYVLPAKTIFFNDMLSGEIGYMSCEHVIEFESAGFSKEIFKELFNDINAGAVYVAELADSKLCVIGTSKKGLVISSAGQSGKTAGDKRGRKYKAQNAGYKWPVLPLSTAAKYNFLLRTFGYGPFYQQNIYLSYSLTVGVSYNFKWKDVNGTNVNLTSVSIAKAESEGAMAVRASAAFIVGDTVILTNYTPITISMPPYRSLSLIAGWAKAVITSIGTDGIISFQINEKSINNGFTAISAIAFNLAPTKFTGLTSAFVPTEFYYGAWELNTNGAVIPCVANDIVHLWFTSGGGSVLEVNAFFVSQVGSVLNLSITAVVITNVFPSPANTGGWCLMKDVGYEV
jgi:hypothetical protein